MLMHTHEQDTVEQAKQKKAEERRNKVYSIAELMAAEDSDEEMYDYTP